MQEYGQEWGSLWLNVRFVTSAPEPLCILYSNAQLLDIEHFCIDPVKFGPLSVDPTFDLGDFNVIVTSYYSLLLLNWKIHNCYGGADTYPLQETFIS